MEDWAPEDLKKAIEAGGNVFLKLWKRGCGACKLSIPAVTRIEAHEATKGMAFGQINTDDHPEIMEIAEIESLPAFFVFRSGALTGHRVGFKGLDWLQSFVLESLSAKV